MNVKTLPDLSDRARGELGMVAIGLGIVAVVMGSVGLMVSWVPFLGLIAVPVGAIGVVLAGVGLVMALTRKVNGLGLSIPGGACRLS